MPLPGPFAKTAQKNTFGGFQSACFHSGKVVPDLTAAPGAVAAGADVLLFSGAGRLDTLLVHQHTQASGTAVAIVFYDAAAVSSGGPFPGSGHKVICFAPSFQNPVAGATLSSGSFLPNFPPYGVPVLVSVPFQSGLCYAGKSGQPGVSVSWTPETAGQ